MSMEMFIINSSYNHFNMRIKAHSRQLRRHMDHNMHSQMYSRGSYEKWPKPPIHMPRLSTSHNYKLIKRLRFPCHGGIMASWFDKWLSRPWLSSLRDNIVIYLCMFGVFCQIVFLLRSIGDPGDQILLKIQSARNRFKSNGCVGLVVTVIPDF